MFSYQAMNEMECNKERGFALMEEGIYSFEVLSATYKNSSTGNPMIEMKLRVWDHKGKEYIVFDYLVSTAKMMWKTKHFCDSVGLSKEYEESKFNESLCPGRTGKASIIYQVGKQKPDGTCYRDKNAVSDYIMTTQGSLNLSPDNSQPFIPPDEDLPF